MSDVRAEIEMKDLSIDRNGDAVMVTAVLLLSLALSVGGSYLLKYGEVVGKEDEMLHITDVEGSLMSVRGSMLLLLEKEDTSTSVLNRVTLGTRGNPYVGAARSSGEMRMESDPESFALQIVVEEGGIETVVNSVNGAITYTGRNYYCEDHIYHFESGGIFIDETGFTTVSSPPSMEIWRTGTGWTMNMLAYGLTGSDWTVSGIETIPLMISMDGFSSNTIIPSVGQIVSIRVNSPVEASWESGVGEVLMSRGLTEGVDFSFNEPSDWSDPNEFLEIDLLTLESFDVTLGEMEVSIL